MFGSFNLNSRPWRSFFKTEGAVHGGINGRKRDVIGTGDPKSEEDKDFFEHNRQILKKSKKKLALGGRGCMLIRLGRGVNNYGSCRFQGTTYLSVQLFWVSLLKSNSSMSYIIIKC